MMIIMQSVGNKDEKILSLIKHVYGVVISLFQVLLFTGFLIGDYEVALQEVVEIF